MATKNGNGNGAWTAEQFVRAWQGAQNATEVAETLGISRQYVYQIAHRIRKAGIPLKAAAGRSRGQLANLDVKALTRLAESLA